MATENALESAAPRIAASSTILVKPVRRLTKVANAIPQDRDTTAASVSSGRRTAGGMCRGVALEAADCWWSLWFRAVEIGRVGLAAEPVPQPSAGQHHQHR